KTAPFCGIGSGRMTSKAERRSVATKRSVSPRSKTSRTLPERSFGMPGSSRSRNNVINNQESRNGGKTQKNSCFPVFLIHYFLMAGLVVKPRARILHGHDWAFSGGVLKVFGRPADGGVIL